MEMKESKGKVVKLDLKRKRPLKLDKQMQVQIEVNEAMRDRSIMRSFGRIVRGV